MFYLLIKITVRLALKIFCRRIEIKGSRLLKTRGPLLITANHPNSFLDAVIIGAEFSRPVHFLARGDAFSKPWHNTFLRLLNMIPVYRLSEGKENLSLNEGAFRRSREILSQNGIVLIFIEGICAHTHDLQPFKKGAARIALESKELMDFRIMPLGITYHSFTRFGKQVHIEMGEPIYAKELLPLDDEAKNVLHFNTVLYKEINRRISIPTKEKNTAAEQYLLFIPAMSGLALHLPLYSLLRNAVGKKTKGTVFFDSVLFGVLLFMYPAYLLLLGIFLFCMQVPASILVIILLLHPVTAWCAVRWK